MDKENSGKEVSGFLSSLVQSLPKEIKYIIGGIIAFLLFNLMIYGLVYLPKAIIDFSNKIGKPTSQCWTLQKIDNQIFKVNTCTGDVVLFDINQELEKQKKGVSNKD